MEILGFRTLIHPADLDQSIDFYRNKLGLAIYREFGAGESRGIVFFAGSGLIEVVSDKGTHFNGTQPPMALWLQVRSIDESVRQLEERGVLIDRAPTLEPWGLLEAWINDPDDIRIHLVEIPVDHPLRIDSRSSGSLN